MSFEEFQNWEPEVEVGVKYKWNNGILEAEEKMKLEEIYIFTNIQKVFQKKSKMSKNSYFISEVIIYRKTSKNLLNVMNNLIPQISIYFDSHPSILSVYLLGSTARGTRRIDSDIDLGIMPFDGSVVSSSELLKMTGDLGYEFGYDFDLGLVQSNNLVYAKEAIWTGERIHSKNDLTTLWKENTLTSMYFNFQVERKVVIDAYRI
jgi:predicted nucleotidyltransferase